MNINEIKEKLKKQEEKATEKKEIDILAAGALKAKAETGIKKLEDNTKRVTDLLDLFAKKVPAMINNLDDINKELEVEKVINVLKEVKENSDDIIRYSNLILNEYKRITSIHKDIQSSAKEEIKNISSLAQEKINTLSSEISKETNLKIKRNQIINLITTIAFLDY